MTDRYHSLTVVLEHDMRDDDAETLISAIRQLRGVLCVSGIVSDSNAHMAFERARADIGKNLWNILYPSRRE